MTIILSVFSPFKVLFSSWNYLMSFNKVTKMCCALYCIFTALKICAHIVSYKMYSFWCPFNGGSFATFSYLILGGQEVRFLKLLYAKICKGKFYPQKECTYQEACVFVLVFSFAVQHHLLLPNCCITGISQGGLPINTWF